METWDASLEIQVKKNRAGTTYRVEFSGPLADVEIHRTVWLALAWKAVAVHTHRHDDDVRVRFPMALASVGRASMAGSQGSPFHAVRVTLRRRPDLQGFSD